MRVPRRAATSAVQDFACIHRRPPARNGISRRLQPHPFSPDPRYKHNRALVIPSPLRQVRHQRNRQHATPYCRPPIRSTRIDRHADRETAEDEGKQRVAEREDVNRQAPTTEAETRGW